MHSVAAVLADVVVGYGSVVIEAKIRGGKIGHIEDIVVNSGFRKEGIGKAVLDELYKIAAENGCYKVALHCKEHNVHFYEKCMCNLSGISMQRLL